jgi:hypothetical protein
MLSLSLPSLLITLAAYRLILEGLPLFNSFLRLIVATVARYLLTGEYLFLFYLRYRLGGLLSWVVIQ